MKEFWDFMFSPVGLAVYALYRAAKLYVWSRVLPRILPHLPGPIRRRAECFQSRAAQVRAYLPTVGDVLDYITLRLPRPMKECCLDRT